ncbi:pyridoxamine 5'-phosphate oxidase [Aquipuribacter sp. SD81]|uniref:pyridoxamine 5'-phosphate oxidase n=1 Tax=Aquipuribacter sp. SD81 TaxID=3127703 RepID=UPI003019AB3A
MRVTYLAGTLGEGEVAPDPLTQFRRWFDDAAASPAVVEPNAMVVSTVDGHGTPSSRTVLCKGVDVAGFRFFTNLTSRKGRELAGNPAVALLFGWHDMERQVGVRGLAEPLGREEVREYFVSRPYASRVGAWASRQSEVLDGREPLEAREAALRARFPDTGSADDVPLPEFWGGFLVRPVEVEFWQGRASRLHDRLVFVRPDGASGPGRLDAADDWRLVRRSP